MVSIKLKHMNLQLTTINFLKVFLLSTLSLALNIQSFAQEPDMDLMFLQIQALKAKTQNQEERIEKLENALKIVPSNQSFNVQKPIRQDQFAWHNLPNWKKIKPGMSRAQVEAILGKPTRVEVDMLGYVKLLYQGEKNNSGYISGNIELNNDDRVNYTGINEPIM